MDGEVDGWCFPSLDGMPAPGPRTMVLVGRTGTGKSTTGNSILGKLVFKYGLSLSGITSNLHYETATYKKNEVVNVIDTPGYRCCESLACSLFNVIDTPGLIPSGSEFISKDLVKCLDVAKDGIHALLLVLSVHASVWYTEEDVAAIIASLQKVLGPKITEYMIVVFTGGDCLERDQSLEDFLSSYCPRPLKTILHACKNRMVLFDNSTNDKKKKSSQRQKLFSLVEKVLEENGGQPYTKDIVSETRGKEEKVNASNGQTKNEPIELMEETQKPYDEQLKQTLEMFDSKLKETNEKLQQQVTEEMAARLSAEKIAKDLEKQVKDLKGNLNKAKKKSEDDVKQLSKSLQLQLKELGENLKQQLDEEKAALRNADKFAHDAQKQSMDEIQKLKNNMAKAKKQPEDDGVKIQKLQEQVAEEKAARLNAEKTSKDLEKQVKDLKSNLNKAKKKSEDDVKQLSENLQSQLKELGKNLEQRLDEEKAALRNAEKFAHDAQKQSKDEIEQLKSSLARAMKQSVEDGDDIQKLKSNLAKFKRECEGDFRLLKFRCSSSEDNIRLLKARCSSS